MSAVRVIVLGNRMRRDDGIALRLAEGLRPRFPSLDWREGATDPLALCEQLGGAELAVVLDATVGAGPPGTVTVADLEAAAAPAGALSSHGADLAAAFALAARLGSAPRRLVVIGVEASDTGHGEHLSPALEAALPQLVADVAGILREFAGGPAELEERCTKPH